MISRFAQDDGRFEALRVANGSPRSRQSLELTPRALVTAAVMLSAFIGFGEWRRVTAVAPEADLGKFPLTIGRWDSRGAQPLPSELEGLPFDQRLFRKYAAPDGAEADLFIGYLQAQRPGRELADQRVQTVLRRMQAPTSAPQGLSEPRVKDFLTSAGGDVYHVTYWYDVDGFVAAEHYEAKLYTAWSSIAQGRNNGSIVIVTTRSEERRVGKECRL